MKFIIAIFFIMVVLSTIKIFMMNTVWGKLLACNIVAANITGLIVLFSLSINESMYLDLTITYLLLNFIGTVLFTRYIQLRGKIQ